MLIDSHHIKTAVLCWLRFGKQYSYVATEVGKYNADVLASNGKDLIEVEIKISKSDLKRDFEDKYKHNVYAQAEDPKFATKIGWVPNKMYFAVPAHLSDFALEYLKEKAPHYGLMVIHDLGAVGAAGISKKAQKMHSNEVSRVILDQMVKRMSSDICNMNIHNVAVQLIKNSIDNVADKLSKMEDIEDKDGLV